MSEVKTKIDQINTELTRPADSDDSTNWELEKDQWGNKLNKTTFSQVDNNSTLLKEILYYHDQKIDGGTDLDSVKAYILNTMLTDGTTTGIVYQSETGTIEINNEIDRHTSIQGVDFTIREYFKKDAQNKWRHYFIDTNNVENYMLIKDDYITLNGLIVSNTTNITNVTNQLNNLIAEGLGSNVWKNEAISANATTFEEKITHGNSIELSQSIDNPIKVSIKSNNTFMNMNVQENTDLSTKGEINFNSGQLNINQIDSSNISSTVFTVSKDGMVVPILGNGNFQHNLSSTPYVIGVHSNGSIVEVPSSEFNQGGTPIEDTIYYQQLDSSYSQWMYYQFEVEQSLLDSLGVYDLTKYNALSTSDKASLARILATAGITDPTDLEAIKTEINKGSSSPIKGVLMKIYTNNIRILMNQEYNVLIDHPLGIDNHNATTRVEEVILSKTPTGTFDSTGSRAITRVNKPNIYFKNVYYQYGSADIGMSVPMIVNIRENGAPSNKFGLMIGTGWASNYEYPKYIGKNPITKLSYGTYTNLSDSVQYTGSLSVTNTTNTNYGNQSMFDRRIFRISNTGRYITYSLDFRYNTTVSSSVRIFENIPSYICPSAYGNADGQITFTIIGSDSSITTGKLTGGGSDYSGGYIEHIGTKTPSTVTYKANFQFLNELV